MVSITNELFAWLICSFFGNKGAHFQTFLFLTTAYICQRLFVKEDLLNCVFIMCKNDKNA